MCVKVKSVVKKWKNWTNIEVSRWFLNESSGERNGNHYCSGNWIRISSSVDESCAHTSTNGCRSIQSRWHDVRESLKRMREERNGGMRRERIGCAQSPPPDCQGVKNQRSSGTSLFSFAASIQLSNNYMKHRVWKDTVGTNCTSLLYVFVDCICMCVWGKKQSQWQWQSQSQWLFQSKSPFLFSLPPSFPSAFSLTHFTLSLLAHSSFFIFLLWQTVSLLSSFPLDWSTKPSIVWLFWSLPSISSFPSLSPLFSIFSWWIMLVELELQLLKPL